MEVLAGASSTRHGLRAGWARRWIRRLLPVLVALMAIPTCSFAQQVRLDSHGAVGIQPAHGSSTLAPHATRLAKATGPLGRYARLLDETPGHPLTLAQAREQLAAGGFRRSHVAVPNLGNNAPPLWLHLNLDNAHAAAGKYRIYVAEGWADKVDAWLIAPDGAITHWQGGDARSPARFLRTGLGFAFDTLLLPGHSELYVRADSIDSVALALRVVQMDLTARLQGAAEQWLGLVHGFLLALLVIYGLLWLSLRETSLLRYVAYIASYLYMHLAYSGIGAQLVWPNSPGVARFAILIGMAMFASAGLWFARDFLDLASWARRTDRAVAWLVRIALLLMALCVVVNSHAMAVHVAFTYMLVFTLVMVALGILGVRRRHGQAGAFLIASLASMVGAFITTLAVMGLVPFGELTFRAVEVGVMTEASILAFALGVRLRRDRRDRALAMELAQHDPLTGLFNRRGFLTHALPAFAHTPAATAPHVAVMLDIDHFKAINDAHGHDAGDRTLVAVADRLRSLTRKGDVIARWGGEEFVILLPATPPAEALAIARRIRDSLDVTPIDLGAGGSVRITASFGVAHLAKSDSLEGLLRQADAALYKAKQAGRNRVETELDGSLA